MTLPVVTHEKTEYARHWAHNAQHFERQECYRWMSDQLLPLAPKKILDIGCGTGEGLLALLDSFSPTVVAVEENAACIANAEKRLSSHGCSTSSIIRIGYDEHRNGSHTMYFDDSPITSTAKVTLVHADILLDEPEMLAFLRRSAPFDAITVWLIGTYMMRQSCQNLAPMKISSTVEYRLHVQNRVYSLADSLLRSGGWLQVIDRGEPPDTDEVRENFLAAHRDQASPTSLEVFDLQYRTYTEPSDWGVGMVATPGIAGRTADLSKLAMHSVLSRKP